MLLVAQVVLGIALSFLLVRNLPLIIRLAALLLLALVMVFLWLVIWPAIGPVRWIRQLNVRRAVKHSSHEAAALDRSGRRIPHSG